MRLLVNYFSNNLFHVLLQVSYERFGTTVTTELLPDGNSIPVTSENRERRLLPQYKCMHRNHNFVTTTLYPNAAEFVSLYVNHLLNESIEKQFTAFYYGFHSVSDSNALTVSPLCLQE